MRTLVVYDSFYGNTEVVAKAIHNEMSQYHKTDFIHVSEVEEDQVYNYDLIVIGSATRNFGPTKPIKHFVNAIKNKKNFNIAVFDTRVDLLHMNALMRLMYGTFGYASDLLARLIYHSESTLIKPTLGVSVSSTSSMEDLDMDEIRKWTTILVELKLSGSEVVPELDIIPEEKKYHVQDLESMSLKELKELARDYEIKGYSSMKKKQLIEQIKNI